MQNSISLKSASSDIAPYKNIMQSKPEIEGSKSQAQETITPKLWPLQIIKA